MTNVSVESLEEQATPPSGPQEPQGQGTPAFRRQEAEAFLDAVFGDRAGYWPLAFKGQSRWLEGKDLDSDVDGVKWPEHREWILGMLETPRPIDVYTGLLLHETPERRKDNAQDGAICWVDLDAEKGSLSPSAIPRELRHYMAFYGSGSPGNHHAYIRLSREVSAERIEELNYRLMRATGNGDSKWSAETVLRLPGTYNYKTNPPNAVLCFVPIDSTPEIDPDALEELLLSVEPPGQDLNSRPGISSVSREEIDALKPAPVSEDNLHPYLRKVLREDSPGKGNRSERTSHLVRTAVECGMSDGEILSLCLKHPPTKEREKQPKELKGDVLRLIKKSRLNHEHIGKTCADAGCPNAPEWMASKATAAKESEDEYTSRRLQELMQAVVDLRSLEVTEVQFLHEDLLVANELGIVTGDGDVGKGNYCVYLSANVARGTLEGSFFGRRAKTLYISTEDDYAKTVLPRLLTHGLTADDLGRIIPLHRYAANLRFPQDLRVLREFCKSQEIEVVIFDKFTDFMGLNSQNRQMDTNKDSDVSEYLTPMQKMAEEARLSIVGIRHTKKGASELNQATLGSVEWRNVPRAGVWLHKDKDGQRTISQIKHNLSPEKKAFEYHLESVPEVTHPVTHASFTGYKNHGFPRFVLGEVTEETGEEVYEKSQQTAKERQFTEKAEDRAYRYLLERLTALREIPTRDVPIHITRSGVSKVPFDKAGRRLVENGIMEKPGRGKQGNWRLLDPTEARRQLELLGPADTHSARGNGLEM